MVWTGLLPLSESVWAFPERINWGRKILPQSRQHHAPIRADMKRSENKVLLQAWHFFFFFLPHCLLSLPLLFLAVAAITSTAATLWTSEFSFFSISMSLSRPFSELFRPLASSWECQTFSLIDRPPTSLLAYQRYAKLLSNYSASRGSNDLVHNVL